MSLYHWGCLSRDTRLVVGVTTAFSILFNATLNLSTYRSVNEVTETQEMHISHDKNPTPCHIGSGSHNSAQKHVVKPTKQKVPTTAVKTPCHG